MNNIDSTAIVSPDAVLGDGVKVGAYALVEGRARIGDGSIIEPHARVCGGARIGKGCRICSFAVVAGDPQDLHFDASLETFAEIGDGSVVRESATIHRATFEGKATIVGRNCLIMASAHIGHDCVLADNVILANFSACAGHVKVANDAFISGGVMVHQRVRIGEGVIISGNSATSLDVPPFVIAYARNNVGGLNLIGMNRRRMPREDIAEVKRLYSEVYATPAARKNALAILESGNVRTAAGRKFLEFFTVENRHYIVPRGNNHLD